MIRVVIDASVAVKWVIEEEGTQDALDLLKMRPLSAPDLMISESANILWKKVRRGELSKDEALVAASLIQRADIECLPTRNLMERALSLAIELDHAAYDCIYLALALENSWLFVTADDRFRRKLVQTPGSRFGSFVVSAKEALAEQR